MKIKKEERIPNHLTYGRKSVEQRKPGHANLDETYIGYLSCICTMNPYSDYSLERPMD